MKNGRFFLVMLLMTFAALIYSCDEDEDTNFETPRIQKLKFSTDTLRMLKQTTDQLKLTIAPEEIEEYQLTWKSTNNDVCTVDTTGFIEAKNAGKSDIIVSDIFGASTKCHVIVSPQPDEPGYITINRIRLKYSFYTGDEIQLKAEILPSTAKDAPLTWTSSNEEVISIDENGKMRGLSPGTSEITVSTENHHTSTIQFTVEAAMNRTRFLISPYKNIYALEGDLKWGENSIQVWHSDKEDENLLIDWILPENNSIEIMKDEDGNMVSNWGGNTSKPYFKLKEGAADGDQVTLTAKRQDGLESTCVLTVKKSDDYRFIMTITNPDYVSRLNMAVGDKQDVNYKLVAGGALSFDDFAFDTGVYIYNVDPTVIDVVLDEENSQIKTTALRPGKSFIRVISKDCGKSYDIKVEITETAAE